MVAAYATGDYTMQEIAQCFDVHYATVTPLVAHLRNDPKNDVVFLTERGHYAISQA